MALVLLLAIFSFKTNIEKRQYKKSYDKKLVECATYEHNLSNRYRKERSRLTDSINYYRALIVEYQGKVRYSNARINEFKQDYAAKKDEVDQTPINDIYGSLTSGNATIGQSNWALTDNQVRELAKQRLNLEECDAIRKEQDIEIHYMDESLKASGQIIVAQDKEINLIDSTMAALKTDYDAMTLENKTLHRKVWTNRGIAIVVSGLAIILL